MSGLGQLKCLHREDVFKSADLFPSQTCVGPNKVDLLDATLVCDDDKKCGSRTLSLDGQTTSNSLLDV